MPNHTHQKSPTPSSKLNLMLLVLLVSFAIILFLLLRVISHFEQQLNRENANALLQVQQDSEVLAKLNRSHDSLILLIEQHEAQPLPEAELAMRSTKMLSLLQILDQDMMQLQQQRQKAGQSSRTGDQMATLVYDYTNHARELTLLAAKDVEAAEAEVVRLSPLLGEMQAELFQLLHREIEQVRADYLEKYTLYKQQQEGLILAAAAAMLLLSARVLIGFRRTNRQLHSAEQALQRMSAGRDDIHLITPDGSFKPLFDGLEHFRQTLQENCTIRLQLQRQNEQLEVQVRERTAYLEAEICQRQVAEQQLKLYETIFQHTDDAALITDEFTTIVAANPAYQRLTGRTEEQLLGKKPPISSSGHHDQTFYQNLWSVLQDEGRWRGEIINRHANGELVHAMMSINAIKRDDGSICNYISILSDITRLKDAEDKLRQMAYFDPLTRLPNRSLLADRLQHEIQISQVESQQLAVIFLDLDRFKYVNDTLGHKAGDHLLAEAAGRLQQCIHNDDTVARLSGDEFCLLLRHSAPSDAALVCEQILQSLGRPFLLDGRQVEIGASLGIALFPDNGTSGDTLMKNADAAMYQAKLSGRNQYCFFESAIEQRLREELSLYAKLRRGIDEGQFILHYQPVIALKPELKSYAECLLRWPQADGSMISPGVFVPFAESHNLIDQISNQVIEHACRMLRKARSQGLNRTVSINLSAHQLSDQSLPDKLKARLASFSLPANDIELELTESALISDFTTAKANLQALRSAGFRIAIDDFGAGYSSLNYLVELPIDKVKIDQGFIWSLFNSTRNQAVVKAVLELANAIGILSVAEGVETKEQYDFLLKHGCHYIQGYYLAKPMSEGDYFDYCRNNPNPIH